MSSEWAIRAQGLSKCYTLFDRPADRLKQMLWRGRRKYFREFWALRDVNLEVGRGEVLGIVGKNGAGKSTLLQLLCGTLTPTSGSIKVQGRVAALLELGAGFNHEFSGRENIYLLTALSGLSRAETEARIDEIIDFSGIRNFIDQPVKTYSSGMFVRLAFSIATSVDPDILVIDEALSVGDGEFARRSFDRIMQFKAQGKTILFCSHALYQVSALCNRVLWIADGKMQMLGEPDKVVSAYNDILGSEAQAPAVTVEEALAQTSTPSSPSGSAHIQGIDLAVDGISGKRLAAITGANEVSVRIRFASDPGLPAPSVGVCFTGRDGKIVTSAGTHVDGFGVSRSSDGVGEVTAIFPQFPLLKGSYWIDIFLLCENGIHVYDSASRIAEIEVSQPGMELGVVLLPHAWR